jgi:hypothetical protein
LPSKREIDFLADVFAGFSSSANKFNKEKRAKKITAGKVLIFISISNLSTTAVAWKNKQRI